MWDLLEFVGILCDVLCGVSEFSTRAPANKYIESKTIRDGVIFSCIVGALVVAISPYLVHIGCPRIAAAEATIGAIVIIGGLLHIPRWRRLARLETHPRKYCTQCETSIEGNTTGGCLNCGAPIIRVKSKAVSANS